MGTTSAERFREFTIRPCEEAEVSLEPDGSIEVLFRQADVTLLLSSDEALRLGGALTAAIVVGGVG